MQNDRNFILGEPCDGVNALVEMKNGASPRSSYPTGCYEVLTFCTLLNSAKLKEDIFLGPQIRKMLKINEFEKIFTLKELKACEVFHSVCHDLRSNNAELDYQECPEKLFEIHRECEISLKFLSLLISPQHHPPKSGTVWDEHGKCFH